MKLAIGDVVRGRHDVALGTVAGINEHTDGRLVVVWMPGGGFRLLEPSALSVVARCSAPSTPVRSVLALLVLAVALFAGFVSSRSVGELGADWLLILLAGLGGCTAVVIPYQCLLRLTGPRRFRV
ncbi:hypothetical protein FGW37_22430 [Streptomyces rectiverticillatus]|uniref:hypothetical protein n=1 Tax=Streptomyces rectiverticillatus TaxID=173860 RepID=UPI0015C30275|nr:hypothetical protein [Streptomyces rectiverticillatus]QLE73969.1 hypothetical protein FGW37_22430 [Streptomyces rectiverticillatus]